MKKHLAGQHNQSTHAGRRAEAELLTSIISNARNQLPTDALLGDSLVTPFNDNRWVQLRFSNSSANITASIDDDDTLYVNEGLGSTNVQLTAAIQYACKLAQKMQRPSVQVDIVRRNQLPVVTDNDLSVDLQYTDIWLNKNSVGNVVKETYRLAKEFSAGLTEELKKKGVDTNPVAIQKKVDALVAAHQAMPSIVPMSMLNAYSTYLLNHALKTQGVLKCYAKVK